MGQSRYTATLRRHLTSAHAMATPDIILHPRWLIPVRPRGEVWSDVSLVVSQGRISALMPTSAARQCTAQEHLDLPHHVLLPGLINCHGHSAMTLLRGYADDQSLMTWLNEYIWPAERAFVGEDFVRDGTDLALAELLLGGTTTFSDQYFFPNITAERADLAGLRAQLCFPIIELATAWATDAEGYLTRGLALRDSYRGHDRIEIGFGPHSNYTVSEATLSRVATLANELDAPLQIHLHESRGEVQMSQETLGERPIDQLSRIGLLGPRTQCVHMTTLCEDDIATIVASGSHVVHCPRSNMKLASGVCPVPQLLKRGVNVALGTDGAASNNRLNMLSEMQMAALLAKVSSGEATALPAVEALELATINGAKALGYEAELGSLELGKWADMIALDLQAPATQPVHDVLSHVVYATSGAELSHSWVAGKSLVADGTLCTLDVNGINDRVMQWRDQLQAFHPHNPQQE